MLHVLRLFPRDFNSHARVGRDQQLLKSLNETCISTHTPAWGVTLERAEYLMQKGISTHTPAWGVTTHILAFFYVLHISTHTPAWGVTFPIL